MLGTGPEGATQMTTVSPATQSRQAPETTGYRSSGQSPPVQTIHLVGCGQVGRRFLGLLPPQQFRVTAVSDATATVFDRQGLDVAAIKAHKQNGGALRTLASAEPVAAELAIGLCAADIVVDATGSSSAGTGGAVARGTAALRSGAFLALCGKNALAAAAADWLLGPARGRVGINAVLGGTGQQLLRELDELRAGAESVALCGNVTTTVIVQAIERGASIEAGIAHARALGILEPDPTLDLDGSDAAVKLLAVHGALFGSPLLPAPEFAAVLRQDVRELDAGLVQQRARHGATTRLVARGSRSGGLRVAFEELPPGSPLAAPPDRVVYSYALAGAVRVHTGTGIGYDATAAALLADVLAQQVRR